MNHVKYIAIHGDRWDSIAFKAYGQPERFPEILAANPNIPRSVFVASGTVIWVPVSEAVEAVASTGIGLPPWKR